MEFLQGLDPSVINAITGTLIPVLVALVTKEVSSSGLKGAINALLAAASAVITEIYTSDAGLVLQEVVASGFTTYVVSIATYYGIWKPTKTTEKVQKKTSEFGLGRRVPTNPLPPGATDSPASKWEQAEDTTI